MTPDPKIDLKDAPVIWLAGREWFVPILALRQNRTVIPANGKLSAAMKKLNPGEEELDEASFGLMITIIHAGLNRAISFASSRSVLSLRPSASRKALMRRGLTSPTSKPASASVWTKRWA